MRQHTAEIAIICWGSGDGDGQDGQRRPSDLPGNMMIGATIGLIGGRANEIR